MPEGLSQSHLIEPWAGWQSQAGAIVELQLGLSWYSGTSVLRQVWSAVF